MPYIIQHKWNHHGMLTGNYTETSRTKFVPTSHFREPCKSHETSSILNNAYNDRLVLYIRMFFSVSSPLNVSPSEKFAFHIVQLEKDRVHARQSSSRFHIFSSLKSDVRSVRISWSSILFVPNYKSGRRIGNNADFVMQYGNMAN